MPQLITATPQVSVRLFKTISRETIDGQSAVSSRYSGKDDYIDLTPFMQTGSSVRTTKSVREPAGGFSISFADKPQKAGGLSAGPIPALSSQDLETVYGLVEPMDMIEIRMWSGMGPRPEELPIIMRGFISAVRRSQFMGDDGRPQRAVSIVGQDYGKIWQIFQVLYVAAYVDGKALLTSQAIFELFGEKAKAAMKSGDFIRMMVDKVLNPFLVAMLPPNTPLPREMQTGDSISVAHGVVNLGQSTMQGSVYDIMKLHGDVGIWNEMYVEDREDGVHVVYRPIPALSLTPAENSSRKIQPDAPDPIYVVIEDSMLAGIDAARSDAHVANFFWVSNSRFDLVDEQGRKLAAIGGNRNDVFPKEYPNSAVKFYGLRPMMGETQQGADEIENLGSGLAKPELDKRTGQQISWLDKRRNAMRQMNQDNVVYEGGSARVKGGPVRPDGESMKAGDYARFRIGVTEADAYVAQIDHEFSMGQSYFTTLSFERGEGFANRASSDGSPYLAEIARRGGL